MQNDNKIHRGITGEIKADSNSHIKDWHNLHFGMFIHIGIYSYLGGMWKGEPVKKGYSEQIQMWADIPMDEYKQIPSRMTLENFDPKAICSLAKDAGMKYIVVTSKHHDGFCMFDTKTTDYNVVESTPFGKDVLKLLSDECQKQGLAFGVYFSLVDWHEGHEFDPNNNNKIPKTMEPLIEEQLTELMTKYGQISEVWFDMSSPTKEQSIKFKEIVHKYQPGAAINGRLWNNEGDFRTLDDNQIPSITMDGAWQTPASIYHATWGYRNWQVRDDLDGKVRDLLEGLIAVRARGGNYLLNIGPQADGSVVEFETDVLKAIGSVIKQHPTAILGTNPANFSDVPWGEITCRDKKIFLHVLNLPEDGKVKLKGLASNVNRVVEDSSNRDLKWTMKGHDLEVTLPGENQNDILTIVRVELVNNLSVIPENIVHLSSNGIWEVGQNAIYYGYNYSDRGNYTSLVQTNVRQSFYLLNKVNGKAMIKIKGISHPNTKYIIAMGSEMKLVLGKDMMNSDIGPFTVRSEDEIIPVHISLAEPTQPNQDLELEMKDIKVTPIEKNLR